MKILRENPLTEDEIREFLFNTDPVEDIARSLSQATEMLARLEKDLAEEMPPKERF